MHVDGEPAARDERPEPCGHSGDDIAGSKCTVVLDARNLPVGEDVAHVRERLRAERAREPDRIDRLEAGRDAVEAGDPGDCEERAERDQRARHDEHERLIACSFHVALSSESGHRHPGVTQARMHW
jgi:hypothetical protein